MPKTAVVSFGRLNPITTGHAKLVDKLKAVARTEKGTPMLYLSHSFDPKKNPLSYDDKYRYAREAFGSLVKKSKSRTLIEVLKDLDSKYDRIVVVVGGDRLDEFKRLLTKYNGKDYTYDSIDIVSAGDRDPDAEDVSGMSASKMRKAAVDGDFKAFKSGLPKGLQSKAEEVYNKIRKNMKIDEALNLQQRMKRKVAMRKIKAKIQRGKRIAARKKASPEKIKKRAEKTARNMMKKKLTGGENPNDMTFSQRERIEKKLEARKGKIKTLAKKLIPQVRKKEQERMKNRSMKKESLDLNSILEAVNDVHDSVLLEKIDAKNMTALKTKLTMLAKKDPKVKDVVSILDKKKLPKKNDIDKLKPSTRDDVYMVFTDVLGPDETMDLFNLKEDLNLVESPAANVWYQLKTAAASNEKNAMIEFSNGRMNVESKTLDTIMTAINSLRSQHKNKFFELISTKEGFNLAHRLISRK